MVQALTLLTMALQLLITANNPIVPDSMKQQAISVAHFAIQAANNVLKESSVSSVSLGIIAPVTVSPEPIVLPPPESQIIYVPVPTPTILPIPTAILSVDKPITSSGIYIVDDGKFTFTWNSTNADKCMGRAEDYEGGYVGRGINDPLGWGWAEDKAVSGTQIITAKEVGDFKFWIKCENSSSVYQTEPLTMRIRQLSQ